MSQLPTVTPSTIQASVSDLRNLRRVLREAGFHWTGLTNAERWRYHSYDYAFLRVRHGIYNRSYPLDPDGKWFHEELIREAERIYEPPRRKPLWSGAPRAADTERDPIRAAHFRRQDAERDSLKRQVQIQGERKASGEPTAEMLSYMRCCARQVEENVKLFDAQNRKAFAPEGRMSQAQVNAELGVVATEHRPKHEDPEQLRLGRLALGLEKD
jgi:hypothetical protein